MTRNRRRAAFLVSASCMAAATSCSSEPKERGQLMIALSADLSIPENMNEVVIEVVGEDGSRQTFAAFVRPEGDKPMPGTMAVIPANQGGELVHIRVIGRRSTSTDVTVRVVREAQVRVPKDRVAMLPMPIRWLCDGNFTPDEDPMNPGSFKSACGPGETCKAGVCGDAVIDEKELPSYNAQRVFGGGDENGNGGTCLDVRKCFDLGVEAVPDKDCAIPMPTSGDGVNVAIVPIARGEGHCVSNEPDRDCYMPLDNDADEGWEEKDGRIMLPPFICDPEKGGTKVKSLVVTTACPTKELSTPLCGPWTNVQAQAPVGGQTTPIGAVDGPPDAGAGEGDSGGGTVTRPDGGQGGAPSIDDGGTADGPPACAGESYDVTLLPAAVHLLVDTSSYMAPFGGTIAAGVDQWAQTRPQHIQVGLTTMEGACGDPMTSIVPTGSPSDGLASAISSQQFTNDLPFEEGLLAAQQDVLGWQRRTNGAAAIAVLTAQGPVSCPAPNAATMTQSAYQSTPPTYTYVIATAQQTPLLTSVANASGHNVDFSDGGGNLESSLTSISTFMDRCRFEVPGGHSPQMTVTLTSEVDGPVNLQFMPQCSDTPAYTVDSMGAPGVLELCPADCARFRAGPANRLTATVGCGSGGGPSAGGAPGGGTGGVTSGGAPPIGGGPPGGSAGRGGGAQLDAGGGGFCPPVQPTDGSPCPGPGPSCTYGVISCICEGTWMCFGG